ncbi:transcriptional regulator [Thalassotalea sp. 42_200_T64]|nr:transcriptional regulator [Thalassotalea sp. 42_200_T64]
MEIFSAVGDALFTKTQQRVFALLFGHVEKSFYLNEIVRFANVGKGSVKRELDKLVACGLITKTRKGNQTHYQANSESLIFNELTAIVRKTFGVVDSLKLDLLPLMTEIQLAFVYGSIASGEEHISSDIDLMVVSENINYSDLMSCLESSEQTLGRVINPTMYSKAEFAERLSNNQSFLTRVMDKPKLWIIGENVVI